MAWDSRLQPISFTTPSGLKFPAVPPQAYNLYWAGDDITVEKRVPLFDYPLMEGQTTQDLGRKAFNYPMTVYFEGADHDLAAWLFLQAIEERGSWVVAHPVYGVRNLQPVSFKLSADPIGSANVSKVETSWIEPYQAGAASAAGQPGAAAPTSAQFASQVTSQSAVVNAAAIGQIETSVSLDSLAEKVAAAGQIAATAGQIKKFLADANSEANKLAGQITTTIQTPITDITSVAGNLVELVQVPGLIIGGVASQIKGFLKLLGAFGSQLPEVTSMNTVTRNVTAVTELSMVATLTAMALAVVGGELTTRSEAVQVLADISAGYQVVTSALDVMQSVASTNAVDRQYASLVQSYPALIILLGLASAFILRSAFDLKVEKRFTLDRLRATIEIAVSEYGKNGWDDAFLDFFLLTNDLHGTDVLYLPVGREIKIYA